MKFFSDKKTVSKGCCMRKVRVWYQVAALATCSNEPHKHNLQKFRITGCRFRCFLSWEMERWKMSLAYPWYPSTENGRTWCYHLVVSYYPQENLCLASVGQAVTIPPPTCKLMLLTRTPLIRKTFPDEENEVDSIARNRKLNYWTGGIFQ